MNIPSSILLASAIAVVATSCSTTYDSYGRPVQTVDPGAAAAGAAAAGVLGYAIGKNNSNDRHYHHYPRPRPRRGHWHHY